MPETRLRLLVADDSADIVGALRRLPEMSADVWKARTGSETIQLLQSQTFDAALIDANLVGPPAAQVYAELRNTRQATDLPVIFVSALGALDQRVAGLNHSRVIAWPMDEDSLRQNLHDLLALRPRASSPSAPHLTLPMAPELRDTLLEIQHRLATVQGDNLRPEQAAALQQVLERLQGLVGADEAARR
ncbi:MAG: response regulator [Candidatus Xenobia bacterium]